MPFTDLVKSFLNQAPYDLPFDVQFSNHLRKCRFLKSFDWDNYCLDVFLWFGLSIQQTTEYGITETWFKWVEDFGYKIILFDRQNNAYVRNIFREYKGAPRALSRNEFDEFVWASGMSETKKWSLKEFLVKDRRLVELKSFDWLISKYPKYPTEDYGYVNFEQAAFSMSFENGRTQHQYSVHEPFKNFLRHHNFPTTIEFLYRMESLVDYLQQFWLQYRDYTLVYNEAVVGVVGHCAFLHGSLLAFHLITRSLPEVIQITDFSFEDSLFIRMRDKSMNVKVLPTVLSVSHCITDDDERRKLMKQFCTRNGLHGKSAIMWPFRSYGIMHTHSEIVRTAYDQHEVEDPLQLDWILDELDSIWPVNIQAPVNEFDEVCDRFYLSRYIAGLLCTKIHSGFEVKHKACKERFADHRQSNQFLLSRPVGGVNCLQVILQIDENDCPVNKVEEMDEHDSSGIAVVKITQYMDHDGALRRNIKRFGINLSSDRLNGFEEIRKFYDLSALNRTIHDQDFQLNVYEAISRCFDSLHVLLNGRQEMKAFINGVFHYSGAITSSDDSISKTVAIDREGMATELFTFNLLTEHEIPIYRVYSMEYDQKMINIIYKKPYGVEIVDVAVFLENEIELLNI